MKKIISSILIISVILILFNFNATYATDITDGTSVISAMEGSSDMSSSDNSIGDIINTVIGLLQVAGTGIAVVVVSFLGIKYLLASPSEKADTKKSILPIVIGCVLLFGAVNLMAAVSDFADKALNSGSGS